MVVYFFSTLNRTLKECYALPMKRYLHFELHSLKLPSKESNQLIFDKTQKAVSF